MINQSFSCANSLHVLRIEVSKIVGWTCAAAVLTYALLYWSFQASAAGASVAAALIAILSLSFVDIVLSPRQLTRQQSFLIGCSMALTFWTWSIIAGQAINYYADAIAFQWMGILVPPGLLAVYYWPRSRDSWCGHQFMKEGSILEFINSLCRIESCSGEQEAAVPKHLTFFGVRLLFEAARKLNFLVVGSIGAGKTTILKQMMRDVLPYVRPTGKFRVVAYDAKNNLLPFLDALRHPEAIIHLLNPFDRRGFSWDMAADCQSVRDAQSIAEALVPERTGHKSDEYFTTMSRALASNAILALCDSRGKDWGLLDVIITVLEPNTRETLLRRSAEGRLCLNNLGSDETTRNSLSSVYSFFYGLIPLAMLMHLHAREGRSLSIEQWIHSPSILVLGGSDSPESSLSSLNRVLIERIQSKLLDFSVNPKDSENRTMLFLDEFSDFGKLEAARRLLRRGREFGVCSVLSFQTVSDLRAAYPDDDQWRALLGQVGNQAFLRMNDDTTAKWAADQIGMRPVKPAVQLSKNSGSYGTTTSVVRGGPVTYDYVIHPSRFLALPVADGIGIGGFLNSGLSRTVPSPFIRWNEVVEFRENSAVPNSVPCPVHWQRITDSMGNLAHSVTDRIIETTEADEEDFDKLLEELKKFSRNESEED